MSIQQFVAETIGDPPFSIGDRVKRPSGALVEITGGQWMGRYGLSNFWEWRKVMPDGSLGKKCSGYGWSVNK